MGKTIQVHMCACRLCFELRLDEGPCLCQIGTIANLQAQHMEKCHCTTSSPCNPCRHRQRPLGKRRSIHRNEDMLKHDNSFPSLCWGQRLKPYLAFTAARSS